MKNNKLINGLVSIVIPVYNAQQFLGRCLESVINQSYAKIEIILVNDGSTDSSGEICSRYALKDNRIKVILQENRGPAASRNTGIQYAKGEFIFFLDADDYIKKETIDILISNYIKYQPELVMSNFRKLEVDGKIVEQNVSFHPNGDLFRGKIKQLSREDIMNYVRHFLKYPSNHLISYCWARLYKLAIIKNNNIFANEKMRLFEDFVFNLDYLKHTNKIIFVNEPLYTYTMHTSYVSASMKIINSDSLAHDMTVFKKKASEFFELAASKIMNTFDIKKEIGHALTHYVIIFLVRSCRQITRNNRKMIYNEIRKIVNEPILKESLKYYSPSKGSSRILPLLMKFKLINLIIYLCQYKAYKRYGKLNTT